MTCAPLSMFAAVICQGPPEMSSGMPSAVGQPAVVASQLAASSPSSSTCAGNSPNRDFQSGKGEL